MRRKCAGNGTGPALDRSQFLDHEDELFQWYEVCFLVLATTIRPAKSQCSRAVSSRPGLDLGDFVVGEKSRCSDLCTVGVHRKAAIKLDLISAGHALHPTAIRKWDKGA